LDKTVFISFRSGYAEAKINYNEDSGKWDVTILEPSDEYLRQPYVVNKRKGITSFDNPCDALLWIAETELGWKEPRNPSSDLLEVAEKP
jgi:hypothetical protein